MAEKIINYLSDKDFLIRDKIYTIDYLKDLYINQNKSTSDMMTILNISETMFQRLLNNYKITKPKKINFISDNEIKIYNSIYTKKDIENLFYNEHLNRKEVADKLSISIHSVDDIVKYFQIAITQELINASRLKNLQKVLIFLSDYKFVYKGKEYQVVDIKEDYLDKNFSCDELQEKYHINKGDLTEIFKYYHIEKNKIQIAEKRKKTCLDKYGVEYVLQSEDIKQKILKTNLQRYGVTNPQLNKEIHLKTQQTCKERYGCITPLANNDIQDKIKNTIKNKYGVNYVSQNIDIQKKVQDTNLRKYGVKSSLSSPEIQSKIQQSNLKKYGVKYPLSLHSVQIKIKQSSLKKYGVNSYMQKNILHFDIWENNEKFLSFLKEFKNTPTIYQLSDYFNVDVSTMSKKIHEYEYEDFIKWHPSVSHYEDEIIKWLQEENPNIVIMRNVRDILSNHKEIDIYLPEYDLGIEFNGNYWHSDIFEKFQDHNGRSLYHQNKSLEAEKIGIFLFHIFEYEWNNSIVQENIKNRLRTLLCKNNTVIYARKCEVRVITKDEKKIFLDNYHIQGNDRSAIYLGLYYQNTLVSCMTFTSSKYKKYNYELSRFCSIHKTNVIGGASKMFKYFVDNYLTLGETVVSYNDITKTSGKVYKILGFTNTSINSPNYVWINFETGDIRSRYQEQKGGEVERMHSQNYHRICDCGTKTWLYTKKAE